MTSAGTFHVLLPRRMQLATAALEAEAGTGPRHAMGLLADRLAARTHEPDDDAAARGLDRLRTLVAPPSSLWRLARRVRSQTGSADAVFCSSEAGGLQLAAACAGRKARPGIAVFVHNVDRPRARLALKWWRMRERIDLFLACSATQVAFLRAELNLPDERVRHVPDHTDTRFFTPGPPSATKQRPLVVSVGLEQRDYKTLAAATADLDVDVRISGFSKDSAALARSFPAALPANMTRRFYAWTELVQLYRDADVVVVSCHENRYAAGVQSLMEAMACRRPIVATATTGLAEYIGDGALAVPPGDAAAMRTAIRQCLDGPDSADERAARGHAVALGRHDMDRYVEEIAGAMRALRPA